MRLIFYGTPDTAVPYLEFLAGMHSVVSVVTQPDRAAGRRLLLTPPPVKTAAQRLGLRVLQPERPADALEDIKAFGADLGVVVAYGKLLPSTVIDAVRLGTLNVHFSLLPKYRGAAPIQWALLRGETRTGVSCFWIDAGMDTGPLFYQKELAVEPGDDAFSLERKLVEVGVEALRAVLESIAHGDIRRIPQSGEPTMAPRLDKAAGGVRFDHPAEELHNQVRALCVWPVAWVETRSREGKSLRLGILKTLPPSSSVTPVAGQGLEAEAGAQQPAGAPPGTVLDVDRRNGILIQCQPGRIWLQKVQPEGRKPMEAFDFANGFRLKPGDVL